MKAPFKLYWNDLKKIFKTPLAIIVLAVLAILPSLYAWLNLQALWDPYANTKHIKIAVVNEDKGDKVREKYINVGDKLVSNLKKDNHFDWQFVSEEKANHEVKYGKYYASINIPNNFSHKITSSLRKHPQKANITYKVNEKINAIAPKMTDAGTSAVVDKANSAFDKKVTAALVSEANKVGTKIDEKVPTINKIHDGVNKAYASLPKINKFADIIIYLDKHPEKFDSYANKFRDLKNYKGEILSAQDKLNEVNSSIPELNRKAQLVLALDKYMPAVKDKLDEVIDATPEKFDKINRGINVASNGLTLAQDKLQESKGYLPQVKNKIKKLQSKNDKIKNNLNNNQINTNTESTVVDSNKGKSYSSNLKTSVMSSDNNDSQQITQDDINSINSSLTEALLSLTDNLDSQTEATQQNIKNLKTISYGILASDDSSQFKEPLENIQSRMKYTTQYNQGLIDLLSELEESEHVDLSNEINKVKSVNNRINDQVRLNNQLLNSLSNKDSGKREAIDILQNIPKLNNKLDGFRTYISDSLRNKIATIANDISIQLENANGELSLVSSKVDSIERVISVGEDLLSKGQQRIGTIQSDLPTIERLLYDGMKNAQSSYPTIKSNVDKAANFVREDLPSLEQRLSNATNTVNDTLPTLFGKYNNAVSLLNENQPKAKEKLHKLADFSQNKLPKLEKDLTKAKSTFDKLEKDDAIDKLVDFLKNNLKDKADTISHPVDYKKVEVFPIKDYGSANVPFYTSLALWVGTLLQISMLSTKNNHPELSLSTRQVFIGKGFLFMTMSILQSFIASLGDVIFFNSQLSSNILFIGTCIFIGLVYISITYTLVSILGNPGKALSIVLLVLQIAGGGGTFPVEVLPQFWQNLHAYLPFSYAIDLLREVVAGPIPEVYISKIIILGLMGLIVFILGCIFKKPLDPFVQKSTKKAKESKVLE